MRDYSNIIGVNNGPRVDTRDWKVCTVLEKESCPFRCGGLEAEPTFYCEHEHGPRFCNMESCPIFDFEGGAYQ